jgi:hypothetical protein
MTKKPRETKVLYLEKRYNAFRLGGEFSSFTAFRLFFHDLAVEEQSFNQLATTPMVSMEQRSPKKT